MSQQNMKTEVKEQSPGWPCRPAQLSTVRVSEHQVYWLVRMSVQGIPYEIQRCKPYGTGKDQNWQNTPGVPSLFWELRIQSYSPCLYNPWCPDAPWVTCSPIAPYQSTPQQPPRSPWNVSGAAQLGDLSVWAAAGGLCPAWVSMLPPRPHLALAKSGVCKPSL